MLSDQILSKCLQAAVAAAHEAGGIVSQAISKKRSGAIDLETDTKSSSVDFVTKYDKRCDAAIMASLTEASTKIFGSATSFGFLTEETCPDATVEDLPTWIVDPIDGTTSFMHGSSDCCIAIALAVNKKPILGVVFVPLVNELFTAIEGKGAFFNGMPIPADRPGRVTQLKDALVGYHLPASRNEVTIKASLGIVQELLVEKNVHSVRCYGSAAIDCCSVALGRMDVYSELGISAWDIASGMVILRESGCVVGGLLNVKLEKDDDNGESHDVREVRTGKMGLVAASTRALCQEMQEVAFKHGLYPEHYFQGKPKASV